MKNTQGAPLSVFSCTVVLLPEIYNYNDKVIRNTLNVRISVVDPDPP
jgi:hypothetical protein